MELVQDGVQLVAAFVAIVLSVLVVEQMNARSSPSKGKNALWAVLISFVCMYTISELVGWFSSLALHLPWSMAYGRVFSFALIGLILYPLLRSYQLNLASRRAAYKEEGQHEQA